MPPFFIINTIRMISVWGNGYATNIKEREGNSFTSYCLFIFSLIEKNKDKFYSNGGYATHS